MDKIKAIVIVGPTASGKTSLGVKIAKHFNGEIVSADSMQIYKKMSIATAKPNAFEMQGIPHHMIDFVEPTEMYSVAKYKEDAYKCIYDISSRGKIPVIVGGTGLYVDTLLYNTEFLDSEIDCELRKSLYEKSEKYGAQYMWDELNKIDTASASKISPNNVKKVIRALEIYYLTGKTLSEQNAESRLSGEILDCVIIGLTAESREFLYDRINMRVDRMLSEGLLDEAKDFFGFYNKGTAVQAIGYKELYPYIIGEKSLFECVEKLKMQTRRYAKRQLTWFRKNGNINWLHIDGCDEDTLVKEAIRIIEERGIK